MRHDDPRHGSHAGYMAHYRAGEKPCEPCRLASAKGDKLRRIDRERGNPRSVPLGDEAWHIVTTTPLNVLSPQTGMSHERLIRYRKGGPGKRVHRDTRDRILAARRLWTPIGIQRRLQALTRLGWSMRAAAETVGADVDGFKRLRGREVVRHVRRPMAEAVLAAYDQLHMTLPPSGGSATETRNEAIRRGYLPPLAWDDIDDETEQPVSSGYDDSDEDARRLSVLEDVAERGGNLTQALRILNIGDRRVIHKWCVRHDARDLYRVLARREAVSENQWTREAS